MTDGLVRLHSTPALNRALAAGFVARRTFDYGYVALHIQGGLRTPCPQVARPGPHIILLFRQSFGLGPAVATGQHCPSGYLEDQQGDGATIGAVAVI